VTNYCCGFLLSPNSSSVLLIRKSHPDWQAGKLNGIGGHLLPKESPVDSMQREFREETDYQCPIKWHELCTLDNGRHVTPDSWCVHFFWAQLSSNFQYDLREFYKANTKTDEPVSWESTAFHTDTSRLPNLRWLVPMAVSQAEGLDKAKSFRISEEYGPRV
jgi:8-oxo-dGTP pyrophosphatase MutT (NUDIX family)